VGCSNYCSANLRGRTKILRRQLSAGHGRAETKLASPPLTLAGFEQAEANESEHFRTSKGPKIAEVKRTYIWLDSALRRNQGWTFLIQATSYVGKHLIHPVASRALMNSCAAQR
jgi:hypothetical protein